MTVPENTLPLSRLRTFTRSPAEPGWSVTAVAEIEQRAGDEDNLDGGALFDQICLAQRACRHVAAGQQRAAGDLAVELGGDEWRRQAERSCPA